MDLLLASGNAGKLKEFQSLLGRAIHVVSPTEIATAKSLGDLPDVLEDGSTYFENALKKAVVYQRWAKVPVLSDDSGLEVEGLDGGPGVDTAFFGGKNATWPERWAALRDALAGMSPDAYRAAFRAVLCYYDGVRPPVFFQGTIEGHVLTDPRGDQGFGFDPVFLSKEFGTPFGEMAPEKKNQISHRAAATRAFLRWWKERDA